VSEHLNTRMFIGIAGFHLYGLFSVRFMTHRKFRPNGAERKRYRERQAHWGNIFDLNPRIKASCIFPSI